MFCRNRVCVVITYMVFQDFPSLLEFPPNHGFLLISVAKLVRGQGGQGRTGGRVATQGHGCVWGEGEGEERESQLAGQGEGIYVAAQCVCWGGGRGPGPWMCVCVCVCEGERVSLG